MERIVPKLNRNDSRRGILYLLLIALTFIAGYGFGLSGYYFSYNKFPKVTITRDVPIDKKALDFGLFWKVWDTVNGKYFDATQIVPANMVYGAIRGMVSAIGDPYTIFLPPKENKVIQEDLQGSFDGIGIQIGFRKNQLAVIAPLSGSPAEKAGVKAGDYIVVIKDAEKKIEVSTAGLSVNEAVQLIRGKKGTYINLTLLRDDVEKPLVLDVVRDIIDVPSVVVKFVGSSADIAHVQVLKFSGETLKEWEPFVADILARRNLTGVIIDVRNNPGGYMQGAVDLAGDFLDNNQLVVIEERGKDRKEYKTDKIARLKNTPMVILVNKGSASASEIFAGALRDQKKVKLIGDTTFGKGTIQEPIEFDNGSGLHITIAKWLTPSGYWVHDKGLEPDIAVSDNLDTTEDEQLQKAIEAVQQIKN